MASSLRMLIMYSWTFLLLLLLFIYLHFISFVNHRSLNSEESLKCLRISNCLFMIQSETLKTFLRVLRMGMGLSKCGHLEWGIRWWRFHPFTGGLLNVCILGFFFSFGRSHPCRQKNSAISCLDTRVRMSSGGGELEASLLDMQTFHSSPVFSVAPWLYSQLCLVSRAILFSLTREQTSHFLSGLLRK